MATSEYIDQVEIAAPVAHSQGQRKGLSTSETLVNLSPPKNRVRTTSSFERLLKVPTAIIDDNNQLRGATTVSQHEGPSESTTQYTPHHQPPQNSIIPYLESMSSVIQGTEVTTFERSSTPGTPLEGSAVSTSEHDLPYELPPHGNVSIQEYTGSHQPTPPEITGEPHGIADILSSAVFTGTSEQSSRKGLLKDIVLECSSPHRFNDELTLAIMRSGNVETLCLRKISPTKWKSDQNIDLVFDQTDKAAANTTRSSLHDAGYIMLIVQSRDGGDEAFLAFTADETYAMAYAEEDTPAEHVFASVKEDNPMAVKMTFTVASSPTFGSGGINTARGLAAPLALGAISDLDRAISAIISAEAFERRFEETGNVDDITQVISHYETAVSSMPGVGVLPAISNNLGNSYARRFKRTGDIQDIDHAISHHQNTVQSTPSGHADLPRSFNNLGTSYLCRFQRTGDVQDIDHAISHHQNAVQSTPSGHADLPRMFNNLGNSYLCRFQRTGDLQDIDHAMSHHQNAVQSTPSGHADLPSWFNNLGSSYLCRFERTGDLQDINHAISHHQNTVQSTPSGHANLPSWFNNLGISYACRFERTGDLQDIDHAISHHQNAVQSTPSGHADLPGLFNSLGNSYLCRFERTGDLQDINHAISHHQNAVQFTPSGHADLPSRFNNLGNSYGCCFERTGDLQDIDHAIFHHQNAVQSTPSGHADLPRSFNNLGNSYLCCFERTGDLQDIDHAISHHQNAVQSTPSGHADLPRSFNNLGTSYLCHFERTGDLQDIDHAISHHQNAVQSTPSGHADLPSLFNSLGNLYYVALNAPVTSRIWSMPYPTTRMLSNPLHLAMLTFRNAVQSTPSGHADLPSRFNNLGNSYFCRFERTSDLQDIEHAISHHQNAVQSTPSGHAALPTLFKNLGHSYQCRFQCTHYFLDVQNSVASYRRPAEANGTPSIRLQSAMRAAMLSSDYSDSHCLIDFANAISLLSEVAGLEHTIHRRHANLHNYSNLVGSAVATALCFNKPDLALEWLEQGCCLVWNQLNQLRAPIDNLRMENPSLAKHFIQVASALESYGTRSALSITSLHATLAENIRLQDATRNHTLHATEYRQLLKEIRKLLDFHDFLQPPKASDFLSSLPSDGPVIIFNIHKTRCDALALIAGVEEPLHIPLENSSLEQAGQLQKTLQFGLLKEREVEDHDRMALRVRLAGYVVVLLGSGKHYRTPYDLGWVNCSLVMNGV
ncbi:hypothetical protein BYT27DRAFT_7240700 [Phlegmacium glaucopus]|nr:hypothetical protein BYT27DRAFT_7240700 [Phlegmacium glaucopus]